MLFVVTITYVAPIEDIEKSTEDHRAYLRKLKTAGRLVASGPFVPRNGGMLLIDAESREQLDYLLRGDPFNQRTLATYEIKQWNPVIGAELFTPPKPQA
ncbi:MAG: hypothetical protein IT462_17705 [Planctomycetes bacterium]|nr:hypothetical protein [Planctomycetota bacterium]